MIRFNYRYLTLLLPAYALLLTAASCTKPSSTNNNNTGNTNGGNASVLVNTDKTKLNVLFAGLRSTPQTINVTAGTMQAVIANNGTKLVFYPYSFVDGTGAAISSGTITLSLIEMYTPGTLIANRATTSAYNVPLKNGGEIFLTASQGGIPVSITKYGVGFYRATPSAPDSMELYYGNTINEDSVVTLTGPSLSSIPGTTVPGTIFDTTQINTGVSGSYLYAYKNHFLFDSVSSLNWVAAAHLTIPGGGLTNLDIVVPDPGFNPSNTEVFVVYDSLKSAMVWGMYDPIKHTFNSNYTIPTGTPIRVITISNLNGAFYYSEHTYRITGINMVVTVSPLPQTMAYIKSKLLSE